MAHFRRIVEDRAGPILLLGRLLLAWLFVHEGLTLAGSLDAALSAMAKLGVAAPLALAAIALQIAAGTALAIGLGARFAAAALGLFCVATAVLFHTKFGIRNELLHFQKDLLHSRRHARFGCVRRRNLVHRRPRRGAAACGE